MTDWQYKVVKSQRGMDGKWFAYPAAAFFTDVDAACNHAREIADEQRGLAGTRINVISRHVFEGECGPTTSVAEYRTDDRNQWRNQ